MEILGLPAYASVKDIPGPCDLAVILVPAKAVPAVLEECGERGIKGAVIISAGFRETGREGKALEQQLIDTAHRYNMRLVGPNVLGIIDTVVPLNASFAAGMPRRGRIAFMSQSGAALHRRARHGAGPGHRLLALLQHRQQGRPERNRLPEGLGHRPGNERHRWLSGRDLQRA